MPKKHFKLNVQKCNFSSSPNKLIPSTVFQFQENDPFSLLAQIKSGKSSSSHLHHISYQYINGIDVHWNIHLAWPLLTTFTAAILVFNTKLDSLKIHYTILFKIFQGFLMLLRLKSKYHVALFQHVWIWATSMLITLSLNSSSFSLSFCHTGFLVVSKIHTNSCLGDFAFVFLSAWEAFLWDFQILFSLSFFLSSVCLLKYYHIRGTFTNTLV